MNKLLALILSALILGVATGCKKLDNDRLPYANVQIVFTDQSMWNFYGVNGALQLRRFIRQLSEPAGFFYTQTTYTGYGGVLLVSNSLGHPLAYDLSCPVECKPDIRVFLNGDNLAECPSCHSTYNVFDEEGTPKSGPALTNDYGLTRYHVYVTESGWPYAVISR